MSPNWKFYYVIFYQPSERCHVCWWVRVSCFELLSVQTLLWIVVYHYHGLKLKHTHTYIHARFWSNKPNQICYLHTLLVLKETCRIVWWNVSICVCDKALPCPQWVGSKSLLSFSLLNCVVVYLDSCVMCFRKEFLKCSLKWWLCIGRICTKVTIIIIPGKM
jgi:hypothetical protein